MTPKLSGLERINAAAVYVFGRRGFASATTQEIAKTGEVSEGLIYRYYDTKQALGLELFKKHYQEVLARLAEEGQRHDNPLQRLRSVVMTFFEWFDENPDVAAFLLRTHNEFLDKVDDEQRLMYMTTSSLKDIIGETLFLLVPSDILSAMVVGAFYQITVECVHGQVKGPLSPRMAPLIDALVGYLEQIVPFPPADTNTEDAV